MHQKIPVVGQDPFGLRVAFETMRQLAIGLQGEADLIGDSLNLFWIGPRADDEVVGERGNPGQIQDVNISGFFRFGRADRNQPRRSSDLRIRRF